MRIISYFGGDIAQCPVSLSEIKPSPQQSKNKQKQISKFSCPVQFYWISLCFFQVFCPGLSEQTKFWSYLTPVWQQQSKNKQKQILNFSYPVQLYWISLFSSKHFVQHCLSKQNFGLNSAQFPLNFNFFIFCISPKHFFHL